MRIPWIILVACSAARPVKLGACANFQRRPKVKGYCDRNGASVPGTTAVAACGTESCLFRFAAGNFKNVN
jgi:hypothetical protein